MSLRWIIVALFVFGAWHQWHQRSQRPVAHSEGVLVSTEPRQVNLERGPTWQKDAYTIKAKAEFEIEARVLSKELYSLGREADLSPVDLALGWGVMSDSGVLKHLTISQANRFYFYRWENEPPRSPREIATHSANMHMVPASDAIAAKLKKVRPGEIVHLRGYLVEISASDGWFWNSSMTREDTGDGACELVRVESVDIR